MTKVSILTPEDIHRLLKTYQEQPENYQLIKNRFSGESLEIQFKRTRKMLMLFYIALNFILIVGAAFSWIGEQKNTFIALSIIWVISSLIWGAVMYYHWKFRISTLKQNLSFFEAFENIANTNGNLDDLFLK